MKITSSQKIWRTIKVFISSTFRDMNGERDYLIKEVFPALREKLYPFHIHLIDIDLRWGVTKEQVENDKVLDFCLNTIDECRPFFIGILGYRYGWTIGELGKSITEMEILHAISSENLKKPKAFFYFRDSSLMPLIPRELKADFIEEKEQNVRSLERLKERIKASDQPVKIYKPCWSSQLYDEISKEAGKFTDFEELGKMVFEDLWNAISEEHKLSEEGLLKDIPDHLMVERDYQEQFMESRLHTYYDREAIQKELEEYINGKEACPLLISGPSGSGKSSMLAWICRYSSSRFDVILPHFVGASPASTDIYVSLRRWCEELNRSFKLEWDLPEDYFALADTFKKMLYCIPNSDRVMIVIDAINQFNQKKPELLLTWLPGELPDHIKMIISCITGDQESEDILECTRGKCGSEISVGSLSEQESLAIITNIPLLSAKQLDEQQIRQLLDTTAAKNPLYLIVALEELRCFGSFEKLNERLRTLPKEGDTLAFMFIQIFQRLEQDYTAREVYEILAGIYASYEGMTEEDLKELLRYDTGAEHLQAILRQLRSYLLYRGERIGFFHDSMKRAVEVYYLPSKDLVNGWHRRLAEYYLKRGWKHRTALEEVIWQLLQIEDYEEISHILLDFNYIEAKARNQMLQALKNEYYQALQVIPEHVADKKWIALVNEAISVNFLFLKNNPEQIFQCMKYHCGWYNSKELKKHQLRSEAEQEEYTYNPQEDRLSLWINEWEKVKFAEKGFSYIRSLRPPVMRLGTSNYDVVNRKAVCIACSPTENTFAAGADDGSILIWDFSHGYELLRLYGHRGPVNKLAYTGDGTRLISASEDSTIRVWDLRKGMELNCLTGHEEGVKHIAISPDSTALASSSTDSTVKIWSLTEYQLLKSLELQKGYMAVDLSYAMNGSTLVCAVMKPKHTIFDSVWIGIWETKTWKKLSAIDTDDEMISCIEFIDNDNLLICQWDIEIEGDYGSAGIRNCYTHKRHHLLNTNCKINSLAIQRSKGLAAFGVESEIQLFDLYTDKEALCLTGHEDSVLELGFTHDGMKIVSVSKDGSIRVWSLEKGSSAFQQPDHIKNLGIGAGYIGERKLEFTPDGKQLVSRMLFDGKLRIFHAEEGYQLYEISYGFAVDFAMNPVLPQIATWTYFALGCTIDIIDVTSGKGIARLNNQSGIMGIGDITYSPCGRWIAVLSVSGEIVVIDTSTYEIYKRIILKIDAPEKDADRCSVKYSPDGRYILVMSHYHNRTQLQLIEVDNGAIVYTLSRKIITEACFSSDGERLAISAEDNILLRNLSVNTETSFPVQSRLTKIVFMKDGAFLLGADEKHQVFLYHIQEGSLKESYHGVTDLEFFANAKGKEYSAWSFEGVTEIRLNASMKKIGCFPAELQIVRSHPSGRMWAGDSGTHLYILKYEEETYI